MTRSERRRVLSVPKAILVQARAFLRLASAAERFFGRCGPGGGREAEEARAAALDKRREARQAFKALKGRGREEWLAVSRYLAESADETGRAVEESLRFGLPSGAADRLPAEMAAALRGAAEELGLALGAWQRGSRGIEHLVKAKGMASETERLGRKARDASLEDSRFVEGLKSREIFRRFSSAAESLQLASDRLAELWALAS